MKLVLLESLMVKDEIIEGLTAELKQAGHEFVSYDKRVEDEEVIIERAKGAEVIIITNLPLSGKVINSLPNLKMISVAFTGVDHIDLDACRRQGIVVCNAPGYSTHSVAELTVGLMINVMRNINSCDQAVRDSKNRSGLIGNEINGKKVGIVGTGSIGLRVAEICKAFGCELIAYSRSQKEKALKLGILYVELETLFKESDIVSIHLPLNKETEGMIDKELIDMMNGSAILINTARGPIVDSKALAQALNEERIRGAGIDVFEMEPPISADHPLVNAKNTVFTPHIAFATPEAFRKRAKIVLDNIKAWNNGNPVNQV